MMREARKYLIFPLDVATVAEARRYVGLLGGHVGMFKVGLELFIRSGPGIVDIIRQAGGGAGIFLDLKLHDIPATVERAMRVVADLGVALATVHCGESDAMLRAAVAGAAGAVKVLGVTVLTSVSGEDIRTAGFAGEFGADVSRLVMKRAAAAKAAGAAGIVCSGLEVGEVKKRFGNDFLCVTPGIRPAWEAGTADDQRRIVTPADAVRDGADYLVIGRPIRDAKDPVAAARRIAAEIA